MPSGKATKEQLIVLESIDATFRFIARTRTSTSVCEIICNLTKRVVAEGEAADEDLALADALTKVTPGEKTKSPAETAARLKLVEAELAAMRGTGRVTVEGKPTVKAADKVAEQVKTKKKPLVPTISK